MTTALEDRVINALLHTSDHQKQPGLDQVFRSARTKGALESLARLRNKLQALDDPLRYWAEAWVVKHKVFDRYLALLSDTEQTFARLQHSDWISELGNSARCQDDAIHARSFTTTYSSLGTISAAKIANGTISSAQI